MRFSSEFWSQPGVQSEFQERQTIQRDPVSNRNLLDPYKIFKNSVCSSVLSLCALPVCRYKKRPEGVVFTATGVTGNYMLYDMGAENWTLVLCKALSTLNHCYLTSTSTHPWSLSIYLLSWLQEYNFYLILFTFWTQSPHFYYHSHFKATNYLSQPD